MTNQKTHWKKLQNPDYLGAYALNPGEDIIVTIKTVRVEKVIGTDGKKEECSVLYFAEQGIKPMILNVTNAKTIQKLFRTPYIEEWAGRKIQIGVESVKAFGDVVDALRVRPFLPRVTVTASVCADCGAVIEGAGKMNPAQMAQYTQDKYGKPLCAACATRAAENRLAEENTARETTSALDAALKEEGDRE